MGQGIYAWGDIFHSPVTVSSPGQKKKKIQINFPT